MTASDPSSLSIRRLRRAELDEVIDWAAEEGWNPGLGDAEAYWAADPEAFVGVEARGALVGSGAILSYGGELGFVGLFIVRPELRGEGIGRRLWGHMRRTLLGRLRHGAPIGLDGVPAMERFYADDGFRTLHNHVRMRQIGRDLGRDPRLVALSELPFDEVAEFDRAHFGAPREEFLRRWIAPRGGVGLALRERGRLRGMGVARPCRGGFKVGPLFAEDEEVADRIFRGLNSAALGEPLFLDVPDCNRQAMALARRYEMQDVFGCARMYLGRPPEIRWERIFGVTTLELG